MTPALPGTPEKLVTDLRGAHLSPASPELNGSRSEGVGLGIGHRSRNLLAGGRVELISWARVVALYQITPTETLAFCLNRILAQKMNRVRCFPAYGLTSRPRRKERSLVEVDTFDLLTLILRKEGFEPAESSWRGQRIDRRSLSLPACVTMERQSCWAGREVDDHATKPFRLKNR